MARDEECGVYGFVFFRDGEWISTVVDARMCSESVGPVKHRGYSLAILTAFVLPFCPYVMYSQLFSTHATWRLGSWISL